MPALPSPVPALQSPARRAARFGWALRPTAPGWAAAGSGSWRTGRWFLHCLVAQPWKPSAAHARNRILATNVGLASCLFPFTWWSDLFKNARGIFWFCAFIQREAYFTLSPVSCWTGRQQSSGSHCGRLFAYNVIPVLIAPGFWAISSSHPDLPWSFWRDRQDLSPRAEMLISDQTQAQFKAVLGAALKKSCSGRVTPQDTHPGFPGSKGSRSLSRWRSLFSQRGWICSSASEVRRLANSFRRPVKCLLN